MTPNWKFSQRDMRKMLADRLVAMRKIRSEVLVEGKVGERKQAYLEQVVQAASFVDALDCPDRTEKLKETMMNCFNEDYSLSRYDVTQDKWWATDERWMSFVLSMRKLAFYFLRGGLNSTEDAFHFFQIMKQLYETEREERKDEMFMQPSFVAKTPDGAAVKLSLPINTGCCLPTSRFAATQPSNGMMESSKSTAIN